MIKISELIQVNHPENTEYQVGKTFDDPSGMFEDGESPFQKIRGVLIGREFQTMDDIAKMASRLRQSGVTQADIEGFIINYIL